jgi:hypothetical protein
LVAQLEDLYARLDELDAVRPVPAAGQRAAVPVDAPLQTRRA